MPSSRHIQLKSYVAIGSAGSVRRTGQVLAAVDDPQISSQAAIAVPLLQFLA